MTIHMQVRLPIRLRMGKASRHSLRSLSESTIVVFMVTRTTMTIRMQIRLPIRLRKEPFIMYLYNIINSFPVNFNNCIRHRLNFSVSYSWFARIRIVHSIGPINLPNQAVVSTVTQLDSSI
jgi:hypothetical protein